MKEKIHLGLQGNGVTVWDSSREVNHDYPTIAHIDYNRTVTYREKVSEEAKREIEHFARYGNTHPVSQPEMLALRPIEDSSFMTDQEKDDFLRYYECSTEGIAHYIREAWDNSKPPMENVMLFHQWWGCRKVTDYLG